MCGGCIEKCEMEKKLKRIGCWWGAGWLGRCDLRDDGPRCGLLEKDAALEQSKMTEGE